MINYSMPKMSSQGLICLCAFTLMFCLNTDAFAHNGKEHPKKNISEMPKPNQSIKATMLEEARPVLPDGVKLTDHLGKIRDLTNRDGKTSILFLGFTHCPDVCPITLQKIKGALKKLDDKSRQKYQVYFMSVDPEHDTLKALGSYVVPLGKAFIGMLPENKDLQGILRNLAAYKRKIGSQLSHTDLLYFVNPDGKWFGFTRVPTQSEQLATILKQIR